MKIAVLVSGGVDSSVALALLKSQGFQVTAFYLKIWLEDELKFLGDTCPWTEDLEFVQAVCQQLEVPLEIISLQKEYFQEVVNYTIAEVKQGNTPNPDIMCNNRIKFGLFIDKIVSRSFDKIASGHYAQIAEIHDSHYLKMAQDSFKDQTYFLANLNQTQLSQLIFPIGHLTKTEVRLLAQEFNLPNKDRKDSQGICFLGKLKFRDFIQHYLGIATGDLIEYETDKIVGSHQGFWFYTIGQRQNIRLPDGPWFVVAKNPAKNQIFVSKNYQQLKDHKTQFLVNNLNLVDTEATFNNPQHPEILIKVRHGEHLHQATYRFITAKNDTLEVTLKNPDQGLASGQFAVFYSQNLCLGSGTIAEVIAS